MHDVAVHASLLGENDHAALHNREQFARHRLYVLNLMSGPGAGKTTILERTLVGLAGRYRMAVIEGDVQGNADAERIAKTGVPVVQINTGGACHLDARSIGEQLGRLPLADLDALIIENVGNLVCPAEFDLGEHDKAIVLSVTEGADKPRKYPVMFHRAQVMLLNKIDLLPHTDFDVARAIGDARAFNLDLEVFQVSARTGAGLDDWCAWLTGRIDQARNACSAGQGRTE